MSKWKWIRDYLLDNGLSQNDLADTLGWQQTRVSELLNDKRDFPKNKLVAAARFFNIDLELLTKYNDGLIGSITPNSLLTKDVEMAELEIIDAVASCGTGIESFHPVVAGRHLISFTTLREITNSKPQNIKILKVRGDSMEPTINDSDVIWVDVSYKAPAGDGLYLFCINGELFVKRLQIDFIKHSIIIKSDNLRYDPIVASDSDNVAVLGKVISINKMLG